MDLILPRRNLFVCLGNVDRSVAGEIIYRLMLEERGYSVGKLDDIGRFDYYVGSAGLLVSAHHAINGSVQLTNEIVRRAGRIFSADEYVTNGLVDKYCVRGEIIVQLNIVDGRHLEIPEQAEDLYAEHRVKLRPYLPPRK